MCRWFIYFGDETILYNILYNHKNSIIKQSYLKKYTPFLEELNSRDHEVNVDGFGIGWYVKNNEVCYYTATKTPWSDFNFKRLSKILESNLIFAHVRAIKPFSNGLIHEFNCHPFNYKNILFMHNGDLKNFNSYKKKVIEEIDDNLYEVINGNTDSEHIFYLILSYLNNKPFIEENVKDAILKCINFFNNVSNNIFSFNIAITNGNLIIFTRYINNDEKPPSLYFCKKQNNINISSEPIDYSDEWTYIPKNVIGTYINNNLSISKI